jgi:urease accessory protein
MTRFSHLAFREENLPQRARDKYFRRTTELGNSKRNPESGHKSRRQFDRGQAMLGTSGPGIATYLTQRNVSLCFHAQPIRWWRSMLDAMSPPNLTDELSVSHTQDVNNDPPSDRDLQRADGCGRIVLIGSENDTRIEDVFERSPIRIMFPRTGHCRVEEAVIINTGGGVAGGDRIECSVTALPGASIAVTSQAAEKVYRALNEPACVATRLKARESARLAWLPQETIIFNWARLHRTTEIDLVSGAELLALEWLVLGRAAHGEVVVGGSITDSWRVKREGRLIWADSLRITDEIFPHLKRKALLSNCTAIATLIYFGPDLDKRLDFLRNIIPSLGCNCAATLVSGLIVVRFAAQESADLKFALRSLLQQFGPELGSGPFRVPKMWSC